MIESAEQQEVPLDRLELIIQATLHQPSQLEVSLRAWAFFTVCLAEEGHYWFAYNSDKHLKGTLGVVVEPMADQRKRFHVVTIVQYHNWAGPVYFRVIRPFHHLVVTRMAQAGRK